MIIQQYSQTSTSSKRRFLIFASVLSIIVGLLSTIIRPEVHAGQPLTIVQPGQSDTPTDAIEPLEVILDRARNPRERSDAIQSVLALPSEERNRYLREILLRGDPEFASIAAGVLVVEVKQSNSLCEELLGVIAGWDEQYRHHLLASIYQSPPSTVRDCIARGYLELAIDGRVSLTKDDQATGSSVGMAASAVSRRGGQDDKVLIRSAIKVASWDHRLWLAVASAGPLETEGVTAGVGRAVVTDAAAPELARVAAAAALATTDPAGEEFAIGRVRSYLEEFCDHDMFVVLAEVAYGKRSREDAVAQKLPQYSEGMGLLGALQFLPVATAESLIFEHVLCEDRTIRNTLAILAIDRWPDRFLELKRDSWPKQHLEDYDRLLGFLVLRHEQLRNKATTKVSEVAIEENVGYVRENGIVAVFPESRNILMIK